MVGPSYKVDVITMEILFLNGWHRPRYDECCATLRMHNGLPLSPLGSITLMVLVRVKVVSTMFVIIPKSDFFCAKLSIP